MALLSDVQHSVRPRSGSSNENKELVRADAQTEAKTSTRKRTAQLQLPEQTLRRILYLGFHVYVENSTCVQTKAN